MWTLTLLTVALATAADVATQPQSKYRVLRQRQPLTPKEYVFRDVRCPAFATARAKPAPPGVGDAARHSSNIIFASDAGRGVGGSWRAPRRDDGRGDRRKWGGGSSQAERRPRRTVASDPTRRWPHGSSKGELAPITCIVRRARRGCIVRRAKDGYEQAYAFYNVYAEPGNATAARAIVAEQLTGLAGSALGRNLSGLFFATIGDASIRDAVHDACANRPFWCRHLGHARRRRRVVRSRGGARGGDGDAAGRDGGSFVDRPPRGSSAAADGPPSGWSAAVDRPQLRDRVAAATPRFATRFVRGSSAARIVRRTNRPPYKSSTAADRPPPRHTGRVRLRGDDARAAPRILPREPPRDRRVPPRQGQLHGVRAAASDTRNARPRRASFSPQDARGDRLQC